MSESIPQRPWWETAAVLISAIPGMAAIVLVILFLSGVGFRTDQNKTDLAQVKQDLGDQITDLKKTVTEGQQEVKHQIESLPVDRAELARHEGQITTLETEYGALHDGYLDLKNDVSNMNVTLQNIVHASNAPIMPGRGR